ncbi:MAG: Na+/H+ antiporter subunit E [Woeseiaceae bacterium]|nr:Na+/H+ antiporter subunit E [Woeseiaceae bacterium]
MKKSVTLTIALALLWFLLSGHTEPLILAFGALSVAFVVWLSRRMSVVDGESYPFDLLPRLLVYWAWLLKEVVKSNVDVARRVLSSRDAVRPVEFDAPARQQSELGLAIYANSITLTPGTVSLRLSSDRIRVHALHPDLVKGLLDSGMNERVPDRTP